MAFSDEPVEILTSSDGEPVALHDAGGVGPPLLMGHGNGLNAGMWAAVIPHLRHRFHCYGIDLRGHGACRPVDPHYDVARERFADDVLACVDHLGAAPTRYVGHSLGGAAVIFAALQRPEAFAALWLFEPVVIPAGFARPDGGAPSALIEMARRRRMVFDSVDDAIARFSSKPPFAGCDPTSVRAYAEVGTAPVDPDDPSAGVRLSCRGEDEARVFGTGEAIDLDRLNGLRLPTLVVCGGVDDDDHAVPAQVAPVLADALGAGRLERHPELTHFGPMEDPVATARSILDFFAE
ncbi:MAG: alpha/beta fold hydrolase [Acidimicrobiales bacterium]